MHILRKTTLLLKPCQGLLQTYRHINLDKDLHFLLVSWLLRMVCIFCFIQLNAIYYLLMLHPLNLSPIPRSNSLQWCSFRLLFSFIQNDGLIFQAFRQTLTSTLVRSFSVLTFLFAIRILYLISTLRKMSILLCYFT